MAHLIAYRALLADIGFVLTFISFHVLDLALQPHPPGTAWVWPLSMSVPATFALLLRRRSPWVAMTVPLVVTISLTLMHVPIGALNLVILVGVYSICVCSSLRASVLAASLALVYPISEMVMLSFADTVLNIIGSLVNLVMVVGWGRAMRVGRLRAGQLQRTISLLDRARDQIAADAAVVERARIAREFHDIVSHNLSVVALRAGVARALLDRDPSHARETLRELERTSSAALDEMRTLLGALRDDGVDETELSEEKETSARQPTPGLDRVDALVDSVRESGVIWRVERRGAIRELRSGVEMTAYRVVQEAVTNVLKHAGPGYARVLLDYGTAALHVEITNHAQDMVPADRTIARTSTTPGHGLVGLRERVALLGGTLTAHPIPGGFHLAAVLPCPEPADLENV